MEMPTNNPWTQYRWRALVDAFLFSATSILRTLGDEQSAGELEGLRSQNAEKMSKIQEAAYEDCLVAFGNDGDGRARTAPPPSI